jgi:hypothetical protein
MTVITPKWLLYCFVSFVVTQFNRTFSLPVSLSFSFVSRGIIVESRSVADIRKRITSSYVPRAYVDSQ